MKDSTTPFIIFGIFRNIFLSLFSVALWTNSQLFHCTHLKPIVLLEERGSCLPRKVGNYYQNCVMPHHTRYIDIHRHANLKSLNLLDSWLLSTQAVASLNMLVPLKRSCSPSVCCIDQSGCTSIFYVQLSASCLHLKFIQWDLFIPFSL